MITFVNQQDEGGVDMDATAEEFEALKSIISFAVSIYDDTELYNLNMDLSDVEDLKRELAMFHDLPLPQENKYLFRLHTVVDEMSSAIVPDVPDDVHRSITVQMQRTDLDDLLKGCPDYEIYKKL